MSAIRGLDIDWRGWWLCCETALCFSFRAGECEDTAGLAGDGPVLVVNDPDDATRISQSN